jgi:hypothetical protein
MAEQRNAYKGIDSRGWVRVELTAADGSRAQLELIADTGCPFDLIVDVATVTKFADSAITRLGSTYGPLVGGWVEMFIKEIGLNARVLAYGNDSLVREAKLESSDFAGLIGLPALRLME